MSKPSAAPAPEDGSRATGPPRREDFCEFLLRRGELTAELAEKVRAEAGKLRIPLGRILMFKRILSVREVNQVLERQNAHPEQRFGSIVLELGLISERQLVEVLREQAAASTHQSEIILQDGLVAKDVLTSALIAYTKQVEAALIA
jgi:hypothetical protein